MDKLKLYDKAYKLWGVHAQLFMLFEKMAELQKAVCKQMRKGGSDMAAVIDEIADVEIMMEQFAYIAVIPREAIEKRKNEKLKRLQTIIAKDIRTLNP